MTTDPYILDLIRAGRHDSPVPIAEIQLRTRMSARAVKASVERPRNNGEPIGASRGAVAGYYLVRTAEDAEAAVRPLWRQILSELRTVRLMLPEARYRELVGQLRIDGGDHA